MTTPTQRMEIRSLVRLPVLICALVLAWVVTLLPGDLRAQEMALPAPTQWSLFDRILGFDRNLDQRIDDGLVIGVVYQGRNRVSSSARSEIVLASQEVPGRILDRGQIRMVSLQATSMNELRRQLEEEEVDLLYITPLRAQDASEITAVASSLRIATLTGVREYMEEGVCLGLGVRGGRPEILVNLEVCRYAGMDLNSELLKLATLIGPEEEDER